MKIKLIFVLLLFVASNVMAGAPTCYSSSGGYCSYSGKVKRIYINSSNLILIYFDTPVALDVPAAIGLNITRGDAAAFSVSSNPEFAKLFYSTALTAQASGRNVSIQMRDVTSGYLQFDRIWLAEP